MGIEVICSVEQKHSCPQLRLKLIDKLLGLNGNQSSKLASCTGICNKSKSTPTCFTVHRVDFLIISY